MEMKIYKAFGDLFKYVTQPKRNRKLFICQLSIQMLDRSGKKPSNVFNTPFSD